MGVAMPRPLGAQSLRIWHLDPFGLTPYYDRALCSALAQGGHDVCLFTSRNLYDSACPVPTVFSVDQSLYFSGMANHRMVRRVLRTIFYLNGHRQFWARLETDPPDIVHFQWCRLPRIDLSLIRRIQQRGIPVIHTIHDVDPLFAYAFAGGLRRVYSAVDRVIVHAQANYDRLIARQPELVGKTHTIAHIATDPREPPHVSRAVARKRLGIPCDVPVLLFFGSDKPYKGLDILLEAVRLARKRLPSLWLIVAGRLSRRHLCHARIRCSNQVIIRSQFVPSDEVDLYHCAADLAVFPYRNVAQSGALITALGYGLPVIVTSVGGMPETIEGNGVVVPPADPQVMAQAICELFLDRRVLAEMGKRSLTLLRERHSPARIAVETLGVYREAMGF